MKRTLWAPVAVAALLLAPAQAEDSPLVGGPMIGELGATHARIWARGKAPGAVSVQVRPRGTDGAWRTTDAIPFAAERALTATVEVRGLLASTHYEYRLRVGEAAVGPWSFRTLPAPGTGKVRLAFGSCLKLRQYPRQPIFGAIEAARPDAFLWLGDNCYYTDTDVEKPERMWERMGKVRAAPDLQGVLAGVSNLAQWDDHDYGPNNGDRTYAFKSTSRDVFTAFWPNPSHGVDGAGIHTRAVLGPVELFLLDARWWRDPNRQVDGPGKGILGEAQVRWLLAGLQASAAPIKVVATGGQFLARYHTFESWNTAKHERQAILAGIREAGVQGVLFISGDRHLAEVARWRAVHVGYDLWEVTSSPLANRYWPEGARHKNPDREFAYGDGPNFGWIEVDAESKTVVLELRDREGKVLWSTSPPDLWPRPDR